MRSLRIPWQFVVVIVPGLLALLFMTVLTYEQDRTELSRLTLQTARSLTLALDRDLLGVQKSLQGFAASASDLDPDNLADFHERAQKVVRDTEVADGLTLVDHAGQQIVNTLQPYGEPLSPTHHLAAVQQVFASKLPFISTLLSGTVAERNLIGVFAPVILNNKVIYSIDMTVTTERLAQLLADQKLKAGWVATIYDRDGIVVGRNLNAEQYIGHKVPPQLIEELANPEGILADGLTQEGVLVTGAFSRSRTTGYSVAVGVPKDTLQANLWQNLEIAAAAIGVTLILSLLFAHRFSSRLRLDLQELTRAVDKVASGEDNVEIFGVGTPEIQMLKQHFWAMMRARRVADDALLAERKRFFEILEAIPAFVVLRTADYKIIFANNIFLQKFGALHSESCAALFNEPGVQNTARSQDGSAEWEWQGPDGRTYAITDKTLDIVSGDALVLKLGVDITKRKDMEDALRQSEDSFRISLTHSPNAIFIIDASSRFIFSNLQAEKLLGYDKEEFLHMCIADTLPHDQLELVMSSFQRNLNGSHEFFEARVLHKDGKLIPVEVNGVPLPNGNILGELVDISSRNEAMNHIRMLSTVVEQSTESIMIADLHANIQYVNEAFIKTSGYSRLEAIGSRTSLLKSGKTNADTYKALWDNLIQGRTWQGEFCNRSKDGREYFESAIVIPVRQLDGEISQYVAIKQDITDQKAIEEKIFKLAYFDPLTDLPNRRLLLDRLGQVRTASTRSKAYGAVMFLDLDKFKEVNDTKGHDYGDMVLVETAKRLRSSVRGSDTVSRIGGDEFVVVLNELGSDAAVATALAQAVGQKVLDMLGSPYMLPDYIHHGSASIGVCMFMGMGENVEELLKRADSAMYRAKTSGRNAMCFF